MLPEGIQLFKAGRFADAVAPLQKAVQADPSSGTARLLLAHRFLQLYYPPSRAPLDYQIVQPAQKDVERILVFEPDNAGALHAQASLWMNQSDWERADQVYRKLGALDPKDAATAFAVAYVAYSRWHPAYEHALAVLDVSNEDPGGHTEPFREPVRSQMRRDYEAMLDRGLEHAHTALALFPRFSDAMGAVSMLMFARSYLRDTPEEFRRDKLEADQWLRRSMEARQR